MKNLKFVEAESIEILREVAAEAKRPILLYSIGKDSSVLIHLAKKAFYPGTIPFSILHIDTLWKFREMYEFRDLISDLYEVKVEAFTNPVAIEKNINPFDHGSSIHTKITKTEALKLALNEKHADFIIAGARRDEEKSRAKERIFSFRDEHHQWNPKDQNPEMWSLYNCAVPEIGSIRVFPLSNWTELDIWQYIHQENIPIVPLYFAKERPTVTRDGTILMVDDERFRFKKGEKIEIQKIRFRSLGCYPLTGAVKSNASNIKEIIMEVANSSYSERFSRKIDRDDSQSMEAKKREGYF